MIDVAASYLKGAAPGWWIVRRGPGYPETPAMLARIEHEPGNPDNRLDRWPPWIWIAEMAGRPCDPYDVVLCREKRPIGEAEYRYQRALCAWAQEWDARDPRLRPYRKTTNLANLPPIRPEG